MFITFTRLDGTKIAIRLNDIWQVKEVIVNKDFPEKTVTKRTVISTITGEDIELETQHLLVVLEINNAYRQYYNQSDVNVGKYEG